MSIAMPVTKSPSQWSARYARQVEKHGLEEVRRRGRRNTMKYNNANKDKVNAKIRLPLATRRSVTFFDTLFEKPGHHLDSHTVASTHTGSHTFLKSKAPNLIHQSAFFCGPSSAHEKKNKKKYTQLLPTVHSV